MTDREPEKQLETILENYAQKDTPINDNQRKKPTELDEENISGFTTNFSNGANQEHVAIDYLHKKLGARLQENLQANDDKIEDIPEHSAFGEDKILKICCKITVESVKWLCIKFENQTKWYQEEIFKQQCFENSHLHYLEMSPEIDYSGEIERKKRDEKVIKELHDQLDNVITQYENRVIYMQEQLDLTEVKLQTTIQEGKKRANEYENIIAEMNQNIISLVESRFENELTCLGNLKNHFLTLHQNLYDLNKKIADDKLEMNNLERNWKKKCDTLLIEKENDKKEKSEIIEFGRKKIKELEETCEQLKIQFSKDIQEKEDRINFLNHELNQNANIEYIRNILISFLTNPDFSIREKLLFVIATVLKFSQHDLEVVKCIWEKEHISLISKGKSKVSDWINNQFFSGNK